MIKKASAFWRPLLLILLVLTGFALASRYGDDIDTLLELGQRISGQPLVLAGVILLMVMLFAFALPGSLVFWLIAPFHPPLLAVPLLLAGSLGGALGAWLLAGWLAARKAEDPGTGQVLALLRRRGDLLTQCALRTLPGFPHSVVNYAGGILQLPLGRFLLAALLGLGVKWTIYASAVYGAAEALAAGDALSGWKLLPLFALSVLLLAGALLRRRLNSGAEH